MMGWEVGVGVVKAGDTIERVRWCIVRADQTDSEFRKEGSACCVFLMCVAWLNVGSLSIFTVAYASHCGRFE